MSIYRAGVALLLSVVCAGALTLVLGSRVLAGTEDPPGTSLGVDWALTPSTVDELTANSQIVVEGYPTSISDGEPIAIDEPAGLPPIPTRLTEFAVSGVLAGDAPDKLTVLQIGSRDEQVREDPAYELGRPYVLFLAPSSPPGAAAAPSPEQTWAITAPEGRLEKTADGSLASEAEGPVAEQLSGIGTDEIATLVDRELALQPSEAAPTGSEDASDASERGGE